MFKFYRSVLTAGIITFGLTACGDDVTITDPPGPPAPGVTSVTVAPSTATVAVGQTVVFAASVIADNGVSTAVTWTSSDPTIATVNGTGQVTGVAAGTTTIIATSSADNGKTGVGTITVAGVGGGAPAQISIQSITFGAFNTPVQLSNVNGQIEVNLNFNPGGQQVDSVRVLIGGKAAATQIFANNAAAGILSMSVNTADYTKNVAAGTTTVDFFNGPATITAVVYTAGGGTTSTQGTQIVLNNTSGFAADITKPTRSGTGVPSSTAIGQTYWGGPGAGGVTSVTVYPVIYESGRSVNTVTFGLGPQAGIGCPTVVDATLPFTQSFGYTGTGLATVNCTSYEWLATNAGGARDNVYVVSAIDNSSNAFASTALIPNTTVFGSTPDSLRVDYFAPTSVTAPVILGSEGFNWLNDAATIAPLTPGILDIGVGGLLSSFTIVVGPSGSGTFPITFTTVAALPETNTNCAQPTPGCDGYAARASGTDVLLNTSNSAVVSTFGVDRTLPLVRYFAGASIFAAGGDSTVTDSTTRVVYAGLYGVDVGTAGFDLTDYLSAALGTGDSVAVSAIDNRSGLSRSLAASRVFAQGGATGTTTNTGCQTATGGTLGFGAALPSGYRPSGAVHVTCGLTTAGYYTTTFSVVDRAGNVSSTYRRTVVIDPNPPQVTGVSPIANYRGDSTITFTIGVQDDLEVIDARLRIRYGNLLLGDGTTTPATGIVFNFGFNSSGFGTRFDSLIVNPFLGTLSLDRFTVSIQETCTGAGAPYAACLYRGDPVDTISQPIVKPDSVAVIVRDVYGSFVNNIQPWNIPMRQTGVSAEFASPILSATVPAGSRYTVTYDAQAICLAGGTLNGPCVIAGINWRNFGGTGTTRTFRATQDNSTTLPIFTRVDLFGLNAAGEWRYIQRITVPAVVPTNSVIPAGAGTILGTDNGAERYWDYSFTGIATAGFTQFRALGVNATGAGLFSARQP